MNRGKRALLTALMLCGVVTVSPGQLPSIDEPGGYEAQVESLARTRKILEDAFEQEPTEYLPKVGRILHKLSLGSMYQIEEKWAVYMWAQEKMLETPGHADHYGKLILDFTTSHGEVSPSPGWRPQYAFESLEHLPSAETVRVLAGLLDHDDDGSDEANSTAESAAKRLRVMLEDPPSKFLFPLTPWLEWRQEVRDGKRTFRFKERKGEYNFEGPVARPGAPDERRPLPGKQDLRNGVAENGSSGGSFDTEEGRSTGRLGIWISLGILVMAIICYLLIRRPTSNGN